MLLVGVVGWLGRQGLHAMASGAIGTTCVRCIFCKKPSDSSRSEEHIIPESLGNTSHVLPPGVVCDDCNNYFARKIEGPLLSEGPIRALRFHQRIASKRNRIPPARAILLPDCPVQLLAPDSNSSVVLAVPAEGLASILRTGGGNLVFPETSGRLERRLWPRFMAKCALEALAHRLLLPGQAQIEALVDHADLDPLRTFARRGQPRSWPIFDRYLYDQNRTLVDDGSHFQTLFEYDLLVTRPDNWVNGGSGIHSELYFVLVLFGHEFAINMGGPEIDGYRHWLDEHQQVSPLYRGKNAVTASSESEPVTKP